MHAIRRTLARSSTRLPILSAHVAAPSRALHWARLPTCTSRVQRRFASSTTPYMTTADPAETEALQALEKGTQALEDGDIPSAKKHYARAVDVQPSAGALFNLGVASYHLRDYDEAISAWKRSIEMQPSADAHTNLASAYIISSTPMPVLAIQHLRSALELAPGDAEIQFNLAAVLEATGNLSEALDYYKKSRDNGVEKAAVHVRNVEAKIFGERLRTAEQTQPQTQPTEQSGS